MIIFTITNKVTGQVYVGNTRNDLQSQWEKMVAAALHNLDYPLYRAIRLHGEENFQVEEWDSVDNRHDLLELEQEAIEFFHAESLKGYKTSTVKILPKKKIRHRKTAVEKEITSLLGDVANSPVDTDLPEISIPKPDAQDQFNPKKPEGKVIKANGAVTRVSPQRIADIVTPSVRDAETASTEKTGKDNSVSRIDADISGSRAHAVVQIDTPELDNQLSAQLEAIQSAADAVIAGTISDDILKSLYASGEKVCSDRSNILTLHEKIEPEVTEPEMDPQEKRIHEAIRKDRERRNNQHGINAAQQKKLTDLLDDVNTRARELMCGCMEKVA
ncbi:hypothetical protein CI610_00116 [invertebrate metagenome]|uniref:GIY-YIG domain-containing protein n=1 Tax=invertebrate metagenome TaxID=1711999 RepID=A0A2H9TCN3_9ZZZZ